MFHLANNFFSFSLLQVSITDRPLLEVAVSLVKYTPQTLCSSNLMSNLNHSDKTASVGLQFSLI